MKGPCLCGDPYCPSCGNLELLKLEAAEENFTTKMEDLRLCAEEYEMLEQVIPTIVYVYRNHTKKLMQQLRMEEKEYADFLLEQIDDLKSRLICQGISTMKRSAMEGDKKDE